MLNRWLESRLKLLDMLWDASEITDWERKQRHWLRDWHDSANTRKRRAEIIAKWRADMREVRDA
jgi:hypothetical protein